MKRVIAIATASLFILCMTSCSRPEASLSEPTTTVSSESTTSVSTILDTAIEESEDNAAIEESAEDTTIQTESSEKETEMVLRINDQVIQVEWENNESVEALKDLVRSGTITLEMTMYGGFEQYGSLGVTLPSNDEQLTTSPGDIVLYTSDKICIYYGVNTWAFTRLGKIQNMSEEDLTSLLGSSDVTVTISID